MELSNIMKLVDAGYTKVEIDAMEGGGQVEQKQVEENPKTEEKKPVTETKTEETTQESQTSDAASEQLALITKTLAQVTEATKAMQAAAIRASEMPQQETTGEILAKVINPYEDKEGSK